MRRPLLAAFAVVSVAGALAAPSSAHAAASPTRWCGGAEETAVDRVPDAVASNQLHVVYGLPSDGTDRFFERVLPIARDLASIDTWWRNQDAARTPRFDLAAFPGCDTPFGGLDISVVRLPQPAAAYAALDGSAYSTLVRDFLGVFSNPYKKYVVFWDGAVTPGLGICGLSSIGPPDQGETFSFIFLNSAPGGGSCGGLGSADYRAKTTAHEILHNLGAVTPSAPHVCNGSHVCDKGDIMTSGGSSNSLFDYALDIGRDDYYGHSGNWWDVQDSAWLSHLDAQQFPLTVAASGSGKGSVASDLPGIACPPACSIAWDSGTSVSLLPSAEGDRSRFAGWTGACSSDGECQVTMDAAKTVGADFRLQAYLRVTVVKKGGAGRVTSSPQGIDCSADTCEAQFDTGGRVTLKAAPDRRSRLLAWSAAACGTKPSCSVGTDADRTVAATFGPGYYRLTAVVEGKGRVRSAPAGLSCSGKCSASFAYARVVKLTAEPAKGWRFAGWTGGCHGASACAVKVTKVSTVHARFRRA